MSTRFSMLRSFHVADVFTLANAACGTGAVFLSMGYVADGGIAKIYGVGGVLLAAVVFDFLDGHVARWRHSASPLGRELDSLADIVSFGVAPACLGLAVGLDGGWDMPTMPMRRVPKWSTPCQPCGHPAMPNSSIWIDASGFGHKITIREAFLGL